MLKILALFSILSFSSINCQSSSSTIERLIQQVDATTPPMGEGLTIVNFDFELQDIEDIVEDKMHLAVKFYEYTSWSDPRLAYKNIANVT